MKSFDFSTFISPFTWRYGSTEMRQIFSEQHKYELWRKIWVALAEAQYKAGLVSKKELTDLQKNEKNINVERILEIEKDTKHDVVAAIKEFAEKAKIGGGKIHLGATSTDITDNADTLKIKESLLIIEKKLKLILAIFSKLIKKYADLPCIGYTHLQPAEPTTVGYRLAVYAQDLLIVLENLHIVQKMLKGKGLKGAVGTAASYQALLQETKMTPNQLEQEVMQSLGLDSVLIATQVYPRQFDYFVLTTLAAIASSVSKFAADVRLLQAPGIGEWSEPFGEKQVGSSAMPFKINPINSENICSLARYVLSLPAIALENASLLHLERTLDDSANRRVIIPEAFLAADQILLTAQKILSGLVINEKRIASNLQTYTPFAATESILMTAVKQGANRQEMHEVLREISMVAWQKIQEGESNPMPELLIGNATLHLYLSKKEIKALFNIKHHLGDAPERALKLVKIIKKIN